MNEKIKWIKEGEVDLDEDKYLFLLNDMLIYPVMKKVSERTGLHESVISFMDRKNKINPIFTSQDQKRGDWGYEFFLNNKKYGEYLKETEEVFLKAEEFRKKIDTIDLEKTSLKEKVEIFSNGMGNLLKAKVLTYFTIHPYCWKIEEILNKELSKLAVKERPDEILGILALQEERDGLENERYDWLKDIVLPILEKDLNFEEINKDKIIIGKIKTHLDKYKSYPAGFDTDLWDLSHYLDLLKGDIKQAKDIVGREFILLRDKAIINRKKKNGIVKKYAIKKEVVRKAQIIGKLANIRLDLRVKAWSFYLYVFRKLLDSCSKKSNLTKKEIGLLTYDELMRILKNNLKVENELKSRIEKRKNGNILAMSDSSGRFHLLYGEEANRKFYGEVGTIERVDKIDELKGTVACRKGIVRGKVFIFRYGSSDFIKRISQFPQGAILVANMTLPVLMPAIRKAKAMVTDAGGITSHAAIVSRELGIPCIIGTGIATKMLKDGDEIEVDTNTGIVRILKN